MLRRVTFEMPHDWYAALEQERTKSGENISQLLRRIVRRSLASRGHSLTDPTIVPGKYDRAEKCLLGLEGELQHEKRLRNRQRVRRQLEKKRVEKQRAEFVARLKFDPSGGVWTVNESEEVGWIDPYGELEVTDRQFTADEVRAELQVGHSGVSRLELAGAALLVCRN